MNSRPIRSQVEVVQYGAAQEQFNISDAVDFVFAYPPLKEQHAIAQNLASISKKIDELIEKAGRAISLQKEHRTALISAAVTGKIDVRDAVADLQQAA
jgi:type I restriction enzyme S subunit